MALLFYSICATAQNVFHESLEDRYIDLGDVTNYDDELQDHAQLRALFQGKEIVMLGEQTHGEGTAFETKIKLIKYLHKELGFDLLLFESGFYSCAKA